MNQEETQENRDFWKEHEEQEKQKRIQGALVNKYENQEYVQARLEQVHNLLRNSTEAHLISKAASERETFLNSVGPFDPLMLLKGMPGFEIPLDTNGVKAARFNQPDREVELHYGKEFDPIYGKGNMRISLTKKGSRYHNYGYVPTRDKEDKIIPIPSSADELYALIADLSLPVNQFAKDKTVYELGYVQRVKQTKKQVKQ